MNLRRWVLPGLTVAGLTALVVVPLVRPDKANHPWDPVARMTLDLAAITPGMTRDAVDKRAVRVFKRPNSPVEVFRHPRTEFLRIDLRFTGPGGSDTVVAATVPYLAPYDTPAPP